MANRRQAYKDPIVAKVIEFLEKNGPTKLKGRYIHGDVLLPNKTELPLCYVTKDQVAVTAANNMEDEHQQALVATIILDHTNDLGKAYNMVAGLSDLWEFVEARGEDFDLLPQSLLYQLRRQQQVAPKMWIGLGTPVTVNYGMGVERRGPGIFSIEATIRFTVRLHLPNPAM